MGTLSTEARKSKAQIVQTLMECKDKPSVFAKTFLDEEVFDYNIPFVDSNDRFIVYRAGSKVGKTTSTAIKALHMALFAPFKHEKVKDKCDIIIIAPTQSQASIMFDVIRTYAHKSKFIESMIRRETGTQLELYFITGQGVSRIFTRAAGEKGDSLRGYIPHIIIADEAAFIRMDVFKAIIPRGLSTKAKVWLISTPFGKQGYFYDKCMKSRNVFPEKYPSLDPNGKWVEFRAKSIDNPLNKDDPEYFAEVADMTAEQRLQELEGEFLDSADSLIPYNLIMDAIGDYQIPANADYYLGVDVARSGKDETVFTVIAVDDKGHTYLVDSYVVHNKGSLIPVVDEIINCKVSYRFTAIYVDETALGAGVVDLARDRGVNVTGVIFTLKEKERMYKQLRLLFEAKRIHMRKIDKMVRQLQYLKRDFTADQRMRIMSEEHDDYPDSLALACKGTSAVDMWYYAEGSKSVFG